MTEQRMERKAVVGLGFFDGLHIGHMALIRRVRDYAQAHHLESVVYTFDEHPNAVIHKTQFSKLLMSNEQKLAVMTEEGIQTVIFDHFNDDLVRLSPKDFVEEVLVQRLHAAHVVVGFNYNFGANGLGNIDCLLKLSKEYGFTVEVVPAVYFEGELVSSTMIRTLLEAGDVGRVERLLGRPYALPGVVSPGRQLGAKMNFPTANIYPKKNLITPLKGVYATIIALDGQTFQGVTNVGTNPTVTCENTVKIETHILDFAKDIYGKNISIQFIELIREEAKFDSIETLFVQISKDAQKARQILDARQRAQN
ncbi:MAG: bifunctional riboflavin kinase/FAD synthetase [Clostridia bacterium]